MVKRERCAPLVHCRYVTFFHAEAGSYGIGGNLGTFVRSNEVANCYYGISGGKYQDNLTASCTAAFTGGTDAGGNN